MLNAVLAVDKRRLQEGQLKDFPIETPKKAYTVAAKYGKDSVNTRQIYHCIFYRQYKRHAK
tara:strand:- start:11416 stop:11598 length:183 start_codon:yes stop_codon:yes gene_type:complete